MMNKILCERQGRLVLTNVEWLRQAESLLGQLTDGEYTARPKRAGGQNVGGHLRHIVEFYECFLNGLPSARIDYDSRKRDLTLETCRREALRRIDMLISRLEGDSLERADLIIRVRMEDAAEPCIAEPYLISSVARELQFLSSHTIHHFALIAAVLRVLGVAVAPSFGVAPSTLRYLAAHPDAEAA
jgi:uncharacterized damage-inducible protein DinB